MLGYDHRRRPVRGARRVRAHARLRVPEHRAEHRQLVPVRRGDQPQQPDQRVRAAAVDAGGRAGRDRPEPADPHGRGRGLPCRPSTTSSAWASSGSSPRTSRCASATSARSATTCSRRSTATRGCRSARSAQDPTRGVIRLRANTAESWYHSLQTQLDKRFSNGLSAGVHYTWSRFEDTASEIFNPSAARWPSRRTRSTSPPRRDARPTTGRTASPATSCGSCRGCASSRASRRQVRSAAGRSARSSRSRAARRSRC